MLFTSRINLNPVLLSLLHHFENKLHRAPNAQPGDVAQTKLPPESRIMASINRDVSPAQKLAHAGAAWCAPTHSAS